MITHGGPGWTEEVLQAWADQDMANTPKDASRDWSSSVETDETTTIYQIRVWFGNPQSALTPTLCMRIDARECLQRMLNVALSSWSYDEGHMFRMSMPLRGGSAWGRKTLGSSDDFLTFIHCARSSAHRGEALPPEMVDSQVETGYDRAFVLRVLADPEAAKDWPLPTRTVQGSAMEPGGRRAATDPWDSDTAGSLSLEEAALEAGDEVSITYDFCGDHGLCARVESVAAHQPPLPEVAFHNSCGDHPTRAAVLSTGRVCTIA